MRYLKPLSKLYLLAFTLLAVLVPVTTQQAAQKAVPVRRVLFIGNSYTYFNNLPQMLVGLAQAAKPAQPLEAEMVTVGGATLKRLWEEGQALAAIKRGGWNYVVLQEQSTLGNAPIVDGKPQIADPKTFHEYARLFDAEIKKAGAQTVFYLTWARQNAPETQAQLTAAYTSIAKELNALLVPVGLAWEAALQKRPELALHIADKSHPTAVGTYLAACVFYATLSGRTPAGLPNAVTGALIETTGKAKEGPPGELARLNMAEASLLQAIAWETVKAQRK
ncbi:MAG: SGNH/GDSL hydrolase family protein [Acidobacteria bacterium]|nr:SGNH/GDSL hydrolase family protein [Acidobacteriota bacterium]MBI3423397.1 SGNH/GDSL hydrolase family protein [Acidobacteriota bacterium]